MENSLKSKLQTSNFLGILKDNETKYANIQAARSLLAFHEQNLYAWHCSKSCVLSVNLGENDLSKQNSVKTLLPTNPPIFEVEHLLFNRIGSLVAIYGSKGIMIMQVPRLYSSKLASPGDSINSVFCRSWHIAERFFTCTNEMSLLHAAWYPGSPTCTHLVILTSNNCLRLYEATDAQSPLQVVNVGGSGYISTQFRMSFPQCYGESPVSFDFGPPESSLSPTVMRRSGSTMCDDIVYPIYILNGNGDIYVTRLSLRRTGSHSSATVEGPLPMYPPAEDNYGTDACSLLCLPSNPPVMVIAMASGLVYHCVLLDNNNSDEDNNKESDSSSSECESALYVHGSVELSLIPSAEDDSGDSFSQLICLYKDLTSSNKYHCCFVHGIYTVVLPFIQKLEDCSEQNSIDNVLPLLQQNDSIVEHLLCTRPLASVEGVPVIGLTHVIENTGVSLLCLLASWEFECLTLLPSFTSVAPPLLSSSLNVSEVSSDLEQRESFEEHICRLLQRSTCTPLLKAHSSSDENPSSTSYMQWLELLSQTTERLRKENIDCLYAVHAQICSRAKILGERKVQQLAELDRCLKEKERLRSKTECLAEKYEDAHVNQQLLLERIEKVMKVLQRQFPLLSNAEVAMKNDFLSVEEKIKLFQVSLDQIKKKLKLQEEKHKALQGARAIEKLTSKLQYTNLGDMQLKHIKEILHEEGKHMADLIKTVVTLKRDVL